MPNTFWVQHQKWSVFWYNRKKSKYVRKRFREDLGAAIKFYRENLDRPGITLHSDNHGYPPPLRITEHERETWRVVTRKGKRYKKKVIILINLMREYNHKGIWWCPYCVQLRRFKFRETERGPEMYCPVCLVSNYLAVVRRHNPQSVIIEMHKRQRRTQSGKRRR